MGVSKKGKKAAPLVVAGLIGSLMFSGIASAHGYVNNGRTSLCQQQINLSCGQIQYEPQSVEGLSGFPLAGPADGQIAGGGHYPDLDVQTATRWQKVTMVGGPNQFTWTLTARHSSADWTYYITKKGWDPNKPLTRDSLEQIGYVDGKNAIPDASVSHTINVPTDRTGYYIILGVWRIADTPNSFYQVIDVNLVSNGGTVTDTTAPTTPTALVTTGQTATSINVSWTASTDNVGVNHYDVFRNGVKVQTVTGTSVTDTNLLPSTQYVYTVQAVDAAGNTSPASTSLTVKTQDSPVVDTVAPTAPSGVHSMGETSSSVNLMWGASTDNVGVQSYEVYRDGVKVSTLTGLSLMDTGLKANTQYTYTVKALDAAGNVSAASAPFVVKTAADTVVPPGPVVAAWDSKVIYVGGNVVTYQGATYKAKWWTQGETPGTADVWQKQ